MLSVIEGTVRCYEKLTRAKFGVEVSKPGYQGTTAQGSHDADPALQLGASLQSKWRFMTPSATAVVKVLLEDGADCNKVYA